jgi:MFS family permease
MSLKWASTVLSIYAVSGIAGNLLLGTLADRLGGTKTLVITAFCLTLLWVALAFAPSFLLLPIAILLGICNVPILTLYGSTLVMVFGRSNVSKAYGLGYLLKLPFMFSLPPLVGVLFDLTGTYRLGFLMLAFIVALSCISFGFVLQIQRGFAGSRSTARSRFVSPVRSPRGEHAPGVE